jgi:predicted nucleic acid-binding protein
MVIGVTSFNKWSLSLFCYFHCPIFIVYQTSRITKDPTDNKFLACALESKADYLISGDKHLREIKHFHGVKIIDVKAFVERVRKG